MRTLSNKGFTLVEILVAVAIIGVLAVVAAPNMSSWTANSRLKSAARDVYSNLQMAKLRALQKNVCAGVQFTTVTYPATGGGYMVFSDDGTGSGGSACNGTQDGTEAVILPFVDFADPLNDYEGVSLISASNIGGLGTVCFNPNGVICGSQSGNIQLRNNKSKWYKITVAAAGGLRLEMSDDGTNWSN